MDKTLEECGRRAIELYERTIVNNPFTPKYIQPTIRQQHFLLHTETREVFFGDNGGGGKTTALLLAALQFVETPGYHAMIVQPDYRTLVAPGGIVSISKEWLERTGAIWNGNQCYWIFPSGATLTFGHAKDLNDAYRYGGINFSFLGVDNATWVSKDTYLYLSGRVRSYGCSSVPLRIRATSSKIGKGVAWLTERFINPETKAPGVVFVSGQRGSNPYINQEMCEQQLAALDPVTRAELTDSWDSPLPEAGEGVRATEEAEPVVKLRVLLNDKPLTVAGAFCSPWISEDVGRSIPEGDFIEKIRYRFGMFQCFDHGKELVGQTVRIAHLGEQVTFLATVTELREHGVFVFNSGEVPTPLNDKPCASPETSDSAAKSDTPQVVDATHVGTGPGGGPVEGKRAVPVAFHCSTWQTHQTAEGRTLHSAVFEVKWLDGMPDLRAIRDAILNPNTCQRTDTSSTPVAPPPATTYTMAGTVSVDEVRAYFTSQTETPPPATTPCYFVCADCRSIVVLRENESRKCAFCQTGHMQKLA